MALESGANNRPLREELDEIVESYADSGERLAEEVGLITRLALKYDASISLVREMKPGELQFNCYQHSFCLVDVEAVTRIMVDYGYIFPSRQFVQYLIDTRLREIPLQDAQERDHVLYVGSQVEHAGKVAGGGIESKWGKGHLWRHGVFEVPLRYGDTAKFFRHISQEDSVQAFHEYARIQGAMTCSPKFSPAKT
jgi:hypothetical protein